MLAAATRASSIQVDRLRSTMAGPPSAFKPPAHLLNTGEAWRRIQVRQLFRLSLEALFYWTIVNLEGKPKGTDALVDMFLDQLPSLSKHANARKWLAAALPAATGSDGADQEDRKGAGSARRLPIWRRASRLGSRFASPSLHNK